MQGATARSSAFESATRRCYICKRTLPLDRFRTITTTARRGPRVYKYTQPSHDCRECNAEWKREQRRRKAAADGRQLVDNAQRRAAAQKRKLDRRIAWAICLAFWKLVKLTRKEAMARIAARQRERRHTDPEYWAACKAKKLRRTRAQRGTQIEPVSIQHVAERDAWTCAICGGAVTRATWSLDHVIPLSKGGPHTYANVVLAHRSCNSKRGAGRFEVQAPVLADPAEPS